MYAKLYVLSTLLPKTFTKLDADLYRRTLVTSTGVGKTTKATAFNEKNYLGDIRDRT